MSLASFLVPGSCRSAYETGGGAACGDWKEGESTQGAMEKGKRNKDIPTVPHVQTFHFMFTIGSPC